MPRPKATPTRASQALHLWLDTQPRGEAPAPVRLAKACHVLPGAVVKWRHGTSRPTLMAAFMIERHTLGAVLVPDWLTESEEAEVTEGLPPSRPPITLDWSPEEMAIIKGALQAVACSLTPAAEAPWETLQAKLHEIGLLPEQVPATTPTGKKLSAPQIAAIRRRHAEGISQSQLARDFGVSQPTIWRAVQ